MVMELLTFPGSKHLAKYCAESSFECSITSPVLVTDTGHLVIASDNPHNFIRCVLDVSVLGVA